MRIRIRRISESDSCTFGILMLWHVPLYTLELPWRQNRANISRIPAGVYSVLPIGDGRKRIRLIGNGCYWSKTKMKEQAGERWGNDIHIGNRVNEIQGCILVGLGMHSNSNDGIVSVSNSSDAMDELLAFINFERGVQLQRVEGDVP